MNEIEHVRSTSFGSLGSMDILTTSSATGATTTTTTTMPSSSSSLSTPVPSRPSVGQCTVSTPGFCCNIEVSLDTLRQELCSQHLKYSEQLLSIVDAQMAHDGSGSSYIAYVIRRGDRELKRRYSEFNSLRKCLQKLYPALIVPPIPEKHSLTDYATKQNRAKQDPHIIEKRKRMLQCFLNRVAWHPILSTDHLFHRFLEPGILWSDILHSAKVATLPKTKSVSLASSLLPAPQVKHPEPKFVEVEAFTLKFETHMKDLLEKTHRKMMRRYHELCTDYGDLGATYNAFSTTESPAVANAVEKLGMALDTLQSTTMKLCHSMEEGVTEPLHEYSQFSEVIKGILKYRNEQQMALESTQETLESKRNYLAQLERVEAEALRLDEALQMHHRTTYPPPVIPKEPTMRGLVGSLSDRLTAMMDTDPEATRKLNLSKTRDMIQLLEAQKEKQSNDMIKISAAIQNDLDRFQKQKIRDLKKLLRTYAEIQIDYCRRNLKAWEEAKLEVIQIPTPQF